MAIDQHVQGEIEIEVTVATKVVVMKRRMLLLLLLLMMMMMMMMTVQLAWLARQGLVWESRHEQQEQSATNPTS
jgi:uncharacterized integral membrane protein